MECAALNLDISIIIPYYEGQAFIDGCLLSLESSLKDTGLSYEIIIVNDSPWEEISILDLPSLHIRVLTNGVNSGIAKTRNHGKQQARGTYLYFIDQDDWVEPGLFASLKPHMDNGIDAVFFNFYLNYGRKTLIRNYNGTFRYVLKHFLTVERLFKYGNFFTTVGQVLIRKEAYPDFVESRTQGADDRFMFISLFKAIREKGLAIAYLEDPLFNYLIHEENYSSRADWKNSNIDCFYALCERDPSFAGYAPYLSELHPAPFHRNIAGILIQFAYKFNFSQLKDLPGLMRKVKTALVKKEKAEI